ncbi:MAG: feaR 1 [Devosia sp.]|nr:feaR 1 [Devosia sp.]
MPDLETGLRSTRFDFAVDRGAKDEFEQWRWAVSPLFDLEIAASDILPDFFMKTTGQHFADIAITATRSSASLFLRDPRVIARGGLDSFTVQAYTEGRYRLTANRVESVVEAGDIVLLDQTRPINIEATAYANLSLTIQRSLLEPLVGRLDGLHGMVLRSGAPMHGLLMAHLIALAGQQWALSSSTAEQVANATARLVAAAADSVAGNDVADGVAPGSVVRRLRAEIESQLGNADLGPDYLAEKFSMSRATLYRLFQGFGGVRQYIQIRRLLHSYRSLARGHSGDRIGAIALRFGFNDQATFSRAFRNAYGLSPREVATIAMGRDLPPPQTSLGFLKLNRWLGGSPS